MKIGKRIFITFFWLAAFHASVQAADSKPTEISLFQKGYQELMAKKYSQALDDFTEALKNSQIVGDYLHFYRAQAYMGLSQWKEAQKDLEEISIKKSHFKLVLDSRILLAQVFFQMNERAKVKPLFARFLRRVRVTEDEPKVLYMLAQSEKLSGHGTGCSYLKQLYSRFPNYSEIQNWDSDLDKNDFLGSPTGCSFTTKDFQERMRNLLWAGLDRKAYTEMVVVSGRLKETQSLLSDVIRSQFDLQEGDTSRAYDLLKPHLSEGMTDPEFLLNFAATASRAGDNLIGSGAYWYVARHFPRTKEGRRALFLSAIMSYQFQDYDGAEYRFKQFLKLYPRHRLVKEVQWHLAWLDYLRGQYDFSIQKLKTLIRKNKRHQSSLSRYQYWLAMNYLRTERNEKARELFEKLAQDPMRGYYAIASQARLASLPEPTPTPFSFLRAHAGGGQYLLPSVDADVGNYEDVDDEETETSFVIDEEERDSTQDVTDEEAVDEGDEPDTFDASDFQSPVLAKRFERAQILYGMGLIEWAKWENYEIERKTRNKEYLKALIQDYQKLGQYHRSSHLAHLAFASERGRGGYTGARALWEAAYPKAYRDLVEKWAQKVKIPQELAWAIMKQESQFKKEAISPVGALGLMQVMPMTGYKMSQLLGEKNFSPQQLLTPPVAIEIGTSYLRRLSKMMNENYGLVAAAYNAGPHRVDLWTKSFGHLDADEFIEHIPFAETRNYVKKVLTNMQIYRELYTGQKDLLTKLNRKFDYEVKGVVTMKEDWTAL